MDLSSHGKNGSKIWSYLSSKPMTSPENCYKSAFTTIAAKKKKGKRLKSVEIDDG